MQRLTQTEDFETIVSSYSTKEQIQKASENFIMSIVALCDEEDSFSSFRTLHYTRFRLQTMQDMYLLNGEGENVSELLFVIDMELELPLRLRD